SSINFIQAAGFPWPTYYHVRQGGRVRAEKVRRNAADRMSVARLATAALSPMATAENTSLPVRRRGPVTAGADSIADVGAVVIRWVETLGDMALFLWRTISWLLSRLPRRDTLIPSFYNIGVLSLPVVALTGTFIGMVLAVQSYSQFRQFGFETRLG